MSQKYIYQINNLTKKIGQREVLKDIFLAFYPGAKIGVLGRNGSGKSTLLRIMAGIDKEFDGEARLSDGFTVRLLEQEPHLNPAKDVQGNVEEAVAAPSAAEESPVPAPTAFALDSGSVSSIVPSGAMISATSPAVLPF